MSTIIVAVFFALAALLAAMAISPTFREKVATSWGVAGTVLLAIFAWIASWFAGAPPTVPPM